MLCSWARHLTLTLPRSQDFLKGVILCESDGTHQIVMSFSPHVVGCSLKKGLLKGGHRHPKTPLVTPLRLEVTSGAFHSTKISEIFEKGTNGTEISWERFQKIRKLSNFRKANHSTENSSNFRIKIKWKENFQENNWVYLRRLASCSEIM